MALPANLARAITRGINLPLVAAAAGLAVYAIVFANAYELRVLTVAGIYAILVIGYQLVFGHAGALSLAQGAFFGLGAYIAGILGTIHGWTFVAAFVPAVLLPAALAALIAIPVLRLESHYFALATLGIGQVALLIAINWQSVTGGANGIPGVPAIEILGSTIGSGRPLLVFVWAWLAICGALSWLMMRGALGRMFETMRESDYAAMSIGIDIARLRLLAFVVSAAMGGLAGSLYVHTIGVVSPAALEFPVMVTCLTIAVIGGRFRVAGAVVGAVLLYNLPEFLRFLDKYYLMAYGAATLAMVVVAPDGLVGALERLRRHWFPEVPAVAPPALTPSPPQFPVADRHPSSLLEIVNLDKRFGGVHAVNRVSLTIGRGEIVGIIGPNGSGKTTLINLITGIYRADSGTVRFRGRDISRTATHVIAAAGIARTFQRSHLVATMTALDNVAVARFAGPRRHGARFDLARARGEAMALLDRLGVADDAMRPCGTLTYGRQRLVEIARGLALAPALMLLDEPAAGLTEVEQADLAGRLRTLVEDGLTLVVIEHAMPFLMPLADRLICLDDGRVIASGPPREVRRDPRVIAAYLGTGRAAKETPT